MNKVFNIKIIFLSFFILFNTETNFNYAQIKVACIGNSITEGFGRQNSKSYPAQIDSIMGQGWEVENFGLSGSTMLNEGDFPYQKQDIYVKVKEFQPDVVIIKLGTNDSKPQNWKFKERFRHDYYQMIYDLQNLNTNPYVILCSPVPAYSKGWSINDSIIKFEIIPAIKSLARIQKLAFVDLYTPLSDHSTWFPDGIHPNEEGLKTIAKVIAKKVNRNKQRIKKHLKMKL